MRRGFTLIELLVVIAIIAILAAILFPVFARAREKARQTQCLSNVKQTMLAVNMYAQDYDETLPLLNIPTGGAPYTLPNGSTYTGSYMLWHSMLYPYTMNYQIWNCPSDSARYSGNYSGSGTYGINTINDGLALGNIEFPAETMFFADSDGDDAYAIDGDDADAAPVGDGHEIPDRHNGGSNIGFVDGHAKFMTQSAIPQRVSPYDSRFWRGTYTGNNP